MPTIARARCPSDKLFYLDNAGRPTYKVLGIVLHNGVMKAVALHTKEKRKFLVGMTATSRMELSNLLPSTSQHAKACARNA